MSPSAEKSPLLTLSNELLLEIMNGLDANSLIIFGLANKRLYQLYRSFNAPVPSLDLDQAPYQSLAWLLRRWMGHGYVFGFGVLTKYRCEKGRMLPEGLEW